MMCDHMYCGVWMCGSYLLLITHIDQSKQRDILTCNVVAEIFIVDMSYILKACFIHCYSFQAFVY